jgi:hypothetical protein
MLRYTHIAKYDVIIEHLFSSKYIFTETVMDCMAMYGRQCWHIYHVHCSHIECNRGTQIPGAGSHGQPNFTFMWPCIVTNYFIITNQMHQFLKFILEWNSKCFGQFLCPSSRVVHCAHSSGICHTDSFRAAAGSGWNWVPPWSCCCMTYTTAEYTVSNSWRWTEEQSKTCRVSLQNKFEESVLLVGYDKETTHFVWLCLIYVSVSECETCFMSLFWHVEFWGCRQIFKKSVPHWSMIASYDRPILLRSAVFITSTEFLSDH